MKKYSIYSVEKVVESFDLDLTVAHVRRRGIHFTTRDGDGASNCFAADLSINLERKGDPYNEEEFYINKDEALTAFDKERNLIVRYDKQVEINYIYPLVEVISLYLKKYSVEVEDDIEFEDKDELIEYVVENDLGVELYEFKPVLYVRDGVLLESYNQPDLPDWVAAELEEAK